jgi:hypothetical protein
VICRLSNFIPITASAPMRCASVTISPIASRRQRTSDGIAGRDPPSSSFNPSVYGFVGRAVTPMTSPMTEQIGLPGIDSVVTISIDLTPWH